MNRLFSHLVLACSLISYLVSGGRDPLQVINSRGVCRSKEQIMNHFNENDGDDATGGKEWYSKIIEVIDCMIEHKQDRSLVNKIFNTKFSDNTNIENGVYLEVVNQCAVLYSSFDSIFSNSFSGSKAVDYFNVLGGVTCFLLKSLELDSVLTGYDQLFRRIVKSALTSGKPMEITFLVNTDDSSSSLDLLSTKIRSYLTSIVTSSSTSSVSLEDVLLVKVETVADKEGEGEGGGVANKSFVEGSSLCPSSELVSRLVSSWTDLDTSSSSSPILSPEQRESLFRIETAFVQGIKESDQTLLMWQKRVGSGRLVGRFSSLCQQLSTTVSTDFRLSTAGCCSPRERAERLRLLQEHVSMGSMRLARQQLSLLEAEVSRDLKTDLLQLWTNTPTEEMDSSTFNDNLQQLLRKNVFRFQTKAAEVGEVSEERLSDLRDQLQQVLKEFPESSSAKLAEVRKVEKETKEASTGGKGKKRLQGFPKVSNLALSLVGMLRPPGFGNLQGFVGYATSLIGLPLDLLLGFHNDGDSPEIMGEDREYPILRVQPKVNFDIDL